MNAGASCAISSNFNTIEYSVPGGLHAISTTSAIVSTAYSAPLSFSSMISKDIYAQYINSDAPERRQVQVGKVAFWDPVAGVIGRSGAGGLQCDGRYAEGRELG
jgi:Na+(H+)/acetate symporter ActP